MEDVAYTENGRVGERRRVQASCMIDGYSTVAGGALLKRHGWLRCAAQGVRLPPAL